MSSEFPMTLRVDAAGSVRRCEPYHSDTSCPACAAVTSPRLRVFGQPFGHRIHPVRHHSAEFVQRTCGHCGTQWLQFHTSETRGVK